MDARDRQALEDLMAIIEATIRELEAAEGGFPLPWPTQNVIREHIARAFEAGRKSNDPDPQDGESA